MCKPKPANLNMLETTEQFLHLDETIGLNDRKVLNHWPVSYISVWLFCLAGEESIVTCFRCTGLSFTDGREEFLL